MKLSDLLEGSDVQSQSMQSNPEITQIAYDSRKVLPGALFVAIKGINTDGHLYIASAIQAGAVAVVAERAVPGVPAAFPYIVVNDSRAMLAVLAARFYHYPSHDIKVIGVTGTNGKTTTTHLIQAIHQEAGWPTAIMGTLYARLGDLQVDSGHTTPEAVEIESFMDKCRQQGAEYLVMEVSSHALALNRVDQIRFVAAVFTNLSQDHLDFHENMQNYLQSKLKLFHNIPEEEHSFCCVNYDDPFADQFIKAAKSRLYTYGLQPGAGVRAENVDISLSGTCFTVVFDKLRFEVEMRLIGMFSVYNALAAITVALAEGIDPEIIKQALLKVEGIPGRFEEVFSSHDFTVVVDYAHTPDGLENILRTARELAGSRLITVFGCGGDRDRSKRPLMGEIAARYSDFCVVTSDNPRSEEPEAIIADIIPGMEKVTHSRYAIIVDRAEAIKHALNLARPGDLVIIAGKGHETYQLVKGRKLDFDDRKVAKKILDELNRA
ncbi:MAG: UDP-N-acetylmuramoyl-L-alanyl-D-glutamate--2,6-diaminopimelate ligase [Syntrophomonadaceae bacterium]|jgi:UDP-N-acetylmuramoyl-L-alanyl-D-glutamate--2,6-diaminopimelate ligase|nr:UDP-N-acetylmuramoyl-L-alanyl-D-glutamate--2,6-diaminopimelate ligase [Syntrophomonadaceae bacterium]